MSVFLFFPLPFLKVHARIHNFLSGGGGPVKTCFATFFFILVLILFYTLHRGSKPYVVVP